MSKKKLLIQEVFEKGKRESGKETKSAVAVYLWSYFDDHFSPSISDKTFIRYHDAFIRDDREINIDSDTLNKMSQYLGYKDFPDFSGTFIKKDEATDKTTVKISVDRDEETLSEKLSNIIINITNEQHFKMPDFLKQNGLGIMEIAFLACLVTGNVVFSNNKKVADGFSSPLGFVSNMESGADKKYMYWNGERYIATDSSFIRPGLEIKAMNVHQWRNFRKVMRKDTLTDVNALGRTWYSKYNNEVEFFTDDGTDPDNGRELRKSTSLIIYKYAGKQKDSIGAEE
ncbi:hypothetical protein ACM46_04125 [Chryseobacterium angstadtii]|uniref:Uncharacterized protein n=1 Tax=Chryseobacterium angstadtii TaxID=558151 RepID=A0A0J7ILE2_9FLAO|nr:hypothetical protein [Chryseobacterium angstadtii]KMQ66704.1 hypothetical protein ACM46_04125 [Chryseobacterium angstadtii]